MENVDLKLPPMLIRHLLGHPSMSRPIVKSSWSHSKTVLTDDIFASGCPTPSAVAKSPHTL